MSIRKGIVVDLVVRLHHVIFFVCLFRELAKHLPEVFALLRGDLSGLS
jgi:hypothetical protein